MAYTKSIPIYGKKIGTFKYVANKDKTDINNKQDDNIKKTLNYTEDAAKTLNNEFAYITNEHKTRLGESPDIALGDDGDAITHMIRPGINELEYLISGVHCNYKTAETDFAIVREKYYEMKNEAIASGKKVRTAYHIIQSFPPDENIDPQLCHQLGLELAEALGPYQCVVATHLDKAHLHNHIVMNAYSYDGVRKYKDDLNAINTLRKINDDIAKNYGLSIIVNPDLQKKNSYKEWLEKKNNNSWKEKVRQDIEVTMKDSTSWEEYKDKMISSGYKIRETNKTVTYTFPTNDNLKVRDTNLGRDYTKEQLSNYWILKQHRTNEDYDRNTDIQQNNSKVKLNFIYVSKYSYDGRRRSELEQLFLWAIKALKAIGNLFNDLSKQKVNTPVNKPLNWKIMTMEDSLKYVLDKGINTYDELQSKINDTGARLSHSKKVLSTKFEEYENAQKLYSLIKDYETLKDIINNLNVKDEDLDIPEFSEEEIESFRAEIMPMTPTQKRELFMLLNTSNYRVDCSYDNISYRKANKIIEFLKGSSMVQPDIVITDEQLERKRIEAKYDKIQKQRMENLKDKYQGQVLSENQRYKLESLLKNTRYNIKVSDLSYYDGLVIINYLDGRNLFKDYYHSPATEPQDKIPSSLVLQLEELLDIRNESIKGNVSDLKKEDAYKLYNYLLNKNYVPEQLREEPKKELQEQGFLKLLSYYNIEDQAYINEYRNLLIRLKKLKMRKEEIEKEYNIAEISKVSAEKEVQLYKDEYRTLKRLEHNISLANNIHFTHGPLYTPDKVIESDKQNIKEEEPNKEDDEIILQLQEDQDMMTFRTEDEYFEVEEVEH